MNREVRLVIVDDHPIFRRGLREIIGERPDFKIVGEASDGDIGIRMVAERKPDIVLLDVDVPESNGLVMARMLNRNNSNVRIVFLTMYRDEEIFNAAMDLGARAYVLKENAADDILKALETVAEGGTFISESLFEMGRKRTDRVQSLLLSKPQIDELTPAERRILKLIAEDHTSKEIADLLKISVKTVDNHRLNICQKLNLHGSHSLLKFAFDHKSQI